MKKTVFSALAAILVGTAFAAANDTLVMFSTKGPDTYADGTQVLDKECYALVWDKDSEPFSVAADGTTTGGDIVLFAPFAEKGRCPKVLFEVDAALRRHGDARSVCGRQAFAHQCGRRCRRCGDQRVHRRSERRVGGRWHCGGHGDGSSGRRWKRHAEDFRHQCQRRSCLRDG